MSQISWVVSPLLALLFLVCAAQTRWCKHPAHPSLSVSMTLPIDKAEVDVATNTALVVRSPGSLMVALEASSEYAMVLYGPPARECL